METSQPNMMDRPKPRKDWNFLWAFECDTKGRFFVRRSNVLNKSSQIINSALQGGKSAEEASSIEATMIETWIQSMMDRLTPEDKEIISNWEEYAIERANLHQ